MSSLQNMIIKLIQSQERNIQLDFYLRSQIIMQIYKLSDVKNWGFDIENQITNDMIIELTFKKQKFDNVNNKRRLLDSDLFEKFYKFERIKEDSYWTGLDCAQKIELIENRILKIIYTVYDLNGETIQYTLNAY